MNWFILATISNIAVSLLHIIIVFFLGAEGYRTFGAGEEFAQMKEQGILYPDIMTIGISIVFLIFSVYTLSGNQTIRPLPFLKWGLILMSSIYLLRGLSGIPMYVFGNYTGSLMLWSSIVSFLIGLFHAFAIRQNWNYLEKL